MIRKLPRKMVEKMFPYFFYFKKYKETVNIFYINLNSLMYIICVSVFFIGAYYYSCMIINNKKENYQAEIFYKKHQGRLFEVKVNAVAAPIISVAKVDSNTSSKSDYLSYLLVDPTKKYYQRILEKSQKSNSWFMKEFENRGNVLVYNPDWRLYFFINPEVYFVGLKNDGYFGLNTEIHFIKNKIFKKLSYFEVYYSLQYSMYLILSIAVIVICFCVYAIMWHLFTWYFDFSDKFKNFDEGNECLINLKSQNRGFVIRFDKKFYC